MSHLLDRGKLNHTQELHVSVMFVYLMFINGCLYHVLHVFCVVLSLKYIFGEHTWIEYWPTREESRTPEYRDQYIGIYTLQDRPFKEICAS